MEVGKDEAGRDHNGLQDNNEELNDARDGNCFGIVTEKSKSVDIDNNGSGGDTGDAYGSRPGNSNAIYATLSVPANATHYRMDHPRRGVAFIFNHEFFTIDSLQPRKGTNEDCKNLKNTLTELGLDVITYQDLNYDEVKLQIEKLSQDDHTHRDLVIIAFLTHGDTGIIYAKNHAYKPESMFAYFTADRCPTLAGKPKIFFLQACQGDNLDPGITLRKTETDGDVVSSYKIPIQADFLIVYSTVKVTNIFETDLNSPGYYSWRNTSNGSWFVQSLCQCLRQYAGEYDLLSILTFVSQLVAVGFESNVPGSPSMHRQKQIPCVMSMLTRLIKFPIVSNGNRNNTAGYSRRQH